MTLFPTPVDGQKFVSLKRTIRSQDQSVIYYSLSAYQLTLCDQVFHCNIGDSRESDLGGVVHPLTS